MLLSSQSFTIIPIPHSCATHEGSKITVFITEVLPGQRWTGLGSSNVVALDCTDLQQQGCNLRHVITTKILDAHARVGKHLQKRIDGNQCTMA
jgi:hypothetical protein